jgi:8-oxo-dGTP pyrophosphatase MutT (NUDIX family)
LGDRKRVHALTYVTLGESRAARASARAVKPRPGSRREDPSNSPAAQAKYRPSSPPTHRPTDEGTPTVAQRTTDDQPEALPPALGSMTLLVAAVIVHDRATHRVVLLQRGRNAKFGQGMWDLPVGKSEPGEPITATAVRELYEETGLTVKAEALKVAHIIHGALGVEAPNGFLTVVFAAHEWTGEPENREPLKHAQVRWVDVDAVPEAFVSSTASALQHYLSGGVGISLGGWS